jgi:FkbM family methyltransferase
MPTKDHARALALLEQGDAPGARHTLQEALRRAVDPEVLNDLAVLAVREGDAAEGADLLRALVVLHPEHVEAAENLAALSPGAYYADAHPDDDARRNPDVARRSQFLQTVADARATHLADNMDFLFAPWGPALPDPDSVGERLAQQLDLLDRSTTLWEALGDEESRRLLLRFYAYRALGPAHVRLQLEPDEYRRRVIDLSAHAMVQADVVRFPAMPMEWRLHRYDLRRLGLPIEVIGPPLPLASTMVFSQYAYRDQAVPARPQPGDVALDVGGCWGDTALWLAHAVGEGGHVHTFEPAPGNRDLLRRNLDLNPALAPRITVWGDPLGPSAGDMVLMPNVIGAGAASQTDLAGDEQVEMLELSLQSVDALVAERRIARVDFLKIDVEGADLGVLEGAAETIRSQRPRLAIACYHKPDDLVTIPDFIASLGMSYTWYLQCSTMTDVDTVAFAVPDKRCRCTRSRSFPPPHGHAGTDVD